MTKQRGVFVLIALLLALLCLWWSLQKYPIQSVPVVDSATLLQQPVAITIHHTKIGENHQYTGELPARMCDSFSTQVETKNSEPSQLTLAFVITSPSSCSDATSSAPFTVLFSSSEEEMPRLGQVLINNAPVAFVVVEDN